MRKITEKIKVGKVEIGGGTRISVQSMTNVPTLDTRGCADQIKKLVSAGCDIVRLAVPDLRSAEAFRVVREELPGVPLVADIHFDYRVAVRCAEYGADKIRISPGNIGGEDRVKQVVNACKSRKIPIRIGVNGGSLERRLLEKYGGPSPDALCESALDQIAMLNRFDFDDIAVSVKVSSVNAAVEANSALSERTDHPLHIGLTEAGSMRMGIIKNTAAISALISRGIGDTVRVSLTADPVDEVYAARDILRALGCEGHAGMNIVSCPTCGRTRINLISAVDAFEKAVRAEGLDGIPVTVAIMGCAVNGPGEASEADVGVAGAVGEAVVFCKGQKIGKIPEDRICEYLISYIKDNYLKNA